MSTVSIATPVASSTPTTSFRKLNVLLWCLQGFVALFIGLASGAPKLALPAEALPMPIPLSQPFMWFVGTCEVLGALGLLLPALTRIRPGLTPVAAVCLVLLTLCATAYQLLAGQPASAVFALVFALLCAFIAYGRWRLVPLRSRAALAQAALTPATA